jgi:hypothetical protein
MGTDNVTHLTVVPPVPAKCFRGDRDCTAACMAYQTPPEDLKHQRWSFCKVITDSHRSTYHLKVIAQSMDTLRVFVEDEKRTQQPVPPKVR